MAADESLADLVQALAGAVRERLFEVRSRIVAAGGDPGTIEILAVSKGFGPEAPLAAIEAGLHEIGENYADELCEKADAVARAGGRASWHYIGRIQRRKVGRLAPLVSCWQTVSRPEEVDAIAARSREKKPSAFIEVNVSHDASRPGCLLSGVPSLADTVRRSGLELRGLMCVGPLGAPSEVTEEAFARVAAENARLGLGELSIGMSGDLEEAVRQKTTMLRLGTALFGPRNPHTLGSSLQE